MIGALPPPPTPMAAVSLRIAASVVAWLGALAALLLVRPLPFHWPPIGPAPPRPLFTQLVMLANTAARLAEVVCTIRSLSKRSSIAPAAICRGEACDRPSICRGDPCDRPSPASRFTLEVLL